MKQTDFLSSEAPANLFELLLELLEHRRAAEIQRVASLPVARPAPTVASRMKAPLKRWLLESLKGQLVSKELVIVGEEIMSQDFLIYVLRHRPELPLALFPPEDHELLRRFVRNKLMYGAVKTFPAHELLDHGYDGVVAKFSQDAASGLNRREAGDYVSFGFRTREPLHPGGDLGALLGHYGLREFADRVPEGAILDVGPFIGDSTFVFSKYFPTRRMFCLEPDELNRARLEENIHLNRLFNVSIVPLGAGLRAERLPAFQPGSSGAGAHSGMTSNSFIELDSIDALTGRLDVGRVGLIKMDIEGQEQNALLGARAVIRRDRPLLLVSLYHRGADLFEIPRLLRDMVPDYQFSFRHLDPRCHNSEFILIAS